MFSDAVTLMLIHLYTYYTSDGPKKPIKLTGNGHPHGNGHVRSPDQLERQAHDAQEFELEGLMSDDEDAEAGVKRANGRPRNGAI